VEGDAIEAGEAIMVVESPTRQIWTWRHSKMEYLAKIITGEGESATRRRRGGVGLSPRRRN
jgi:hypothetical protein